MSVGKVSVGKVSVGRCQLVGVSSQLGKMSFGKVSSEREASIQQESHDEFLQCRKRKSWRLLAVEDLA